MHQRIILFLAIFFSYSVQAQNNITQYEYWFNSNYASRVTSAIAPVQTLDLIQGIPTSSATHGLNIFNIRFKDANGVYSAVTSQQFFKLSGTSGVTNTIVKYEYWFDGGYQNKVVTTVTPQETLQLISGIVTSGLSNGLHVFNIRFLDERGSWSNTTSQQFFKLSSTQSSNNRIAGYEYWYDTDYQNHTSVVVAPQETLQLITDFSAALLQNGLHVMNIRFKDERGEWSNTTSQHFFKLSPTSGNNNTITGYEYWFDNNYAQKVSQSVTPQSVLTLNAPIDAMAIANGLHLFNVRFKDERGEWSAATGQHFFKSGNTTGTPNAVNGYRYWVDTSIATATTVDIPVTTNPRFILDQINLANLDTGKHYLHLQFRDLASTWSSSIKDSFIQLGKPRIDTLIPSKGGTGYVTTAIFGTGFYQGTTVKLTRTGYTDIIVPDSMMSIVFGQRINATLDLHNQAVGFWNVVVIIPNDTVMTIPNGFEIIPGIAAAPFSDIVGFNVIRVGQWQQYVLSYGNTGNVDATGVPLYIAVSDTSAEMELLFALGSPSDTNLNYSQVPDYYIVDTLFGETGWTKIYVILLPCIPPNYVGTLSFRVKVNGNQVVRLSTWTTNPLYASPMSYEQAQCLHSYIALASTFVGAAGVPYIGCIYSILDATLVPYLLNRYYPDQYQYAGFNLFKTVASVGISCGLSALGLSSSLFTTQRTFYTMFKSVVGSVSYTADCHAVFDNLDLKKKDVSVVNSFDPNDKLGPVGSGLNQYVSDTKTMEYMIHFENVDTAIASVQDVLILDTLDVSKFRLSTLQLGFVAFGDTIINIPIGSKHFTSYIDLRPKGNDVIVRIKGDLNDTTGILKWTFTTLDPVTMLHTTNPLAGFLPPNINEPEGEGSVFYSIKVKDSLANNSLVANKAYIYFDTNPPIPTNTYSNTIDNKKPHSEVQAFPAYTLGTAINVHWSGIDTSSGVLHYSVYYSVNNGPYHLWLSKTTATTEVFSGQPDSTYRFYSIAIDSASNAELPPASYDAITTVHLCTAFAASVTPLGPTTFCQGDSVILQASNAYHYTWSNGDTTNTTVIRASSVDSVTVSDLFGCTAKSAPIVTTVLPSPNVSLSGLSSTYCINSSPVSLVGTPAGGTFSGSGMTTNSFSPANAGAGTHSVTYQYTNSFGCSNDSVVITTVNPLPLPLISANGPLSFCQGSNVTLTSTPAVGYTWSNASNTQNITVNTAGSFSVTVTDTNGCVGSSATVTTSINPLPSAPSISGNSSICSGQVDTLTITNPCAGCTFSWSNSQSGQQAYVSVSGLYTATSANSCGISGVSNSIAVTVHPLPSAQISAGGPTTFCQGGTVALTASPAGTYLWSNNATTPIVNASSSGSYTVSVTDINGCSATSAPVSITVNPLPVAGIISSGPNTFCAGGSVVLNAGSYSSYLWSNSLATQSITVNTAGNYSVTVTDANGCSATSAAVAIAVNPLPTPVITPAGNISICQGATQLLTASIASSYLWSNSAATQSISVGTAGNYSVTVTDGNGCSGTTAPVVISVDPLPVVPVIAGLDTVCSGGSTTLSVTNSCPACSFAWSNSGTGQSINVGAAGAYTATATNNCGTSLPSNVISLVVNPLPVATITPNGPTTFCQGDSVTLTSSPAAAYQWSNTATSQSVTVNTSGLFTVVITDTNLCVSTPANIAVTVNPLPVIPVITAAGSILTSSYVYGNQWYLNGSILPGDTSQNLNVLASGTYTVQVTDTSGCSSTSPPFVFTGINSLASSDPIKIYPNPTPGIFNIDIGKKQSAFIKISNALGQVIYQSELKQKQIDLSNQARGVYLIEVQLRDGVYKEKLIIR
jgi:hypothetical protein